MFGFLKKDSAPETQASAATPAAAPSWRDRLKAGLAKTRAALTTPLGELFSGGKISDELLEELESTLLMADCGIDATQWLLSELKVRVKRDGLETGEQLREALA